MGRRRSRGRRPATAPAPRRQRRLRPRRGDLAFADGAIVGAIDFDFCSPGPRLWDIAYFATRIVPLTGTTPEGAPGMDDARRRVELILCAYGSDATWEDVLRVAARARETAAWACEANLVRKPHNGLDAPRRGNGPFGPLFRPNLSGDERLQEAGRSLWERKRS